MSCLEYLPDRWNYYIPSRHFYTRNHGTYVSTGEKPKMGLWLYRVNQWHFQSDELRIATMLEQ